MKNRLKLLWDIIWSAAFVAIGPWIGYEFAQGEGGWINGIILGFWFVLSWIMCLWFTRDER